MGSKIVIRFITGPFLALAMALLLQTQLTSAARAQETQGTPSCQEAKTWAPLYGSEFTFTNLAVIEAGRQQGDEKSASPANELARDQWKEWVEKNCPECKITEGVDREGNKFYRVTHPSSFWFQIAVDPWVVETQMKPLTLEQLHQFRPLIERLVFQGAKESAGLTPHHIIGGGHIHFDLQTTFGGNARYFRNFFADYQNYPELSVGAFGNNADNAPPLAVQNPAQRAALQSLLAKFDESQSGAKPMGLEELARGIEEHVYTDTSFYKWDPKKYQSINLSRISSDKFKASEKTMEIRGFRPQRDVEDFMKILELFEGRLKFLGRQEGPVAYHGRSVWIDADPDSEELEDPQRVVDSFYDYVTSAGLSWERYKTLLPDFLLELTPKALSGAK